MNADKGLLDFVFEAGQLKREKRVGWWRCGIKDPESDADHAWRTAVIAYALAGEEGADAEKACALAVFHEMAEARLGDRQKISTAYLKTPEAVEKRILRDQCATAGKTGAAVLRLFEADAKTIEIMHDADRLECAVQAKEYADVGFSSALEFMDYMGRRLKTKTAKKLFEVLKKADSHSWWKGLERE